MHLYMFITSVRKLLTMSTGILMFLSITCSPTLILLVRAPSGKTACTWGTTVLLRTPPSGPIRLLSCLMRDTTAKYCGKSLVMIRQMRFFSSSSGVSSSGRGRQQRVTCVRDNNVGANWQVFCCFPRRRTDPHPCRWVSGWAPPACVHNDAPSSSLRSRSSGLPAPFPFPVAQRSGGSPQLQDWRGRGQVVWVSKYRMSWTIA